MLSYRITKYNPIYRDKYGSYQKNDWTSICDIGGVFNGKKLTFDEYKHTEDSYVQAILLFMKFLKLKSLFVTNIEKNCNDLNKSRHYSPQMHTVFKNAATGSNLNSTEIASIARLALRQDVWCKLESEKMYVHFGDDYYMFVGGASISDSLVKKIEKLGLFVEEFESPYHEDMTEEDISIDHESEIIIICSPLRFYTAIDEDIFFEWLKKIPCIKEVKGVGRELHVYIRSLKISNDDLLNLMAIYERYKFDQKQLEIFMNKNNASLFES